LSQQDINEDMGQIPFRSQSANRDTTHNSKNKNPKVVDLNTSKYLKYTAEM